MGKPWRPASLYAGKRYSEYALVRMPNDGEKPSGGGNQVAAKSPTRQSLFSKASSHGVGLFAQPPGFQASENGPKSNMLGCMHEIGQFKCRFHWTFRSYLVRTPCCGPR